MSLEKYLQISWRKIWILIVAGFVSILLHNAWYVVFGFEEAVFFTIVVILIPIYFVVIVVYSLARVVGGKEGKKGKKVKRVKRVKKKKMRK